MRPLEGRRVAVLEGRRPEQLTDLIGRAGGVAIVAPAVRETRRPADSARFIDRLIADNYTLVVVQTGAGISALIEEAVEQGRQTPLLAALRRTPIACRGPKPLAVLKRFAIPFGIVTERPHTSAELLQAIEPTPLAGAALLLLHYGERNASLAAALTARGALVDELCLYEWTLPEDVEPVRRVVRQAVDRQIDALLVTSQIQFRHLMQVAEEMSLGPALTEALNADLVVGAVGPVCAAALRDAGVVPDVMPALPNSASLVRAVADYFELTREDDAHTDRPS